MAIKWLREHALLFGLLLGVCVILLGRWIINASSIADRLIAPLLVSDSAAAADAVVVLGAGLVGECVPNHNSLRRTILGARLFKAGRAPLMVITGGVADGTCPVAEVMAGLARELGVPAEKILTERESRNTRENGDLAAPLLRQRHIDRILLVTDQLHMRRAVGAFARNGFTVEPVAVPVYEGHPDNVSMLTAGLRETAALAYYRLRRWDRAERMAAVSNAAITEQGSRGASPLQDDRVSEGTVLHQRETTEDRSPVVLLGASYVASWPLGDFGGASIVNAGTPGHQTADMLERFDRDVVALRPRAVVLWGFINDISRSDDRSQAVTVARENFGELINRARAHRIEPILATEVTIRAPKTVVDTLMATVGWALRKPSYQDAVNDHVIAMNDWLRETGQRDGLLVLDLQRTLGDGNGIRRWAYAAADGSHISVEGYRELNNYARPILARHLKLTSAEPADKK